MSAASAFLGQPYRILYDSKDARSGLTDIVATVIKPDLTPAAVVALPEIAAPGYQGCYSGTFSTLATDLEGEWICRIASPTEGILSSVKVSMRAPYDRAAAAELLVMSGSLEQIAVLDPTREVTGLVDGPTLEITGLIDGPLLEIEGLIVGGDNL
jgi:hypothetical protein